MKLYSLTLENSGVLPLKYKPYQKINGCTLHCEYWHTVTNNNCNTACKTSMKSGRSDSVCDRVAESESQCVDTVFLNRDSSQE